MLSYPDSLATVGDSTQLYIFGHRSPKSDTIEDNAGHALATKQLARQLRNRGLSRSIRTIKLNACNSGTGGLRSTTARLVIALHAEGFPGVEVYGYTEPLMVESTEGHKRGESGRAAKKVRVGFEAVEV